MLDEAHDQGLVGLDVVDSNGKSIGNVEFVFNDEETGEPEWLGVISGTFRQQRVLVPGGGCDKDRAFRAASPGRRSASVSAPRYGEKDRGGILGFGSYSLGISRRRSGPPTLTTASKYRRSRQAAV